ncbi:hypothetical protein [Legionella rubrilucens]|nr:hypothetical protein [Legionella rubrilucens]
MGLILSMSMRVSLWIIGVSMGVTVSIEKSPLMAVLMTHSLSLQS